MPRLSKEQQQHLILDRLQGLSREALASKYKLSIAGVKSVLLRNKVALPMEQRQSNAYQAKLAKNPDAMAHMRKTLTSEVVTKRSASIKKRYAGDATLRALKGDQSRSWWASCGPDSKYTWADVEKVITPLGLQLPECPLGPMNQISTLVRCHCGLVWESRAFDLLYGKVLSCGCVKSQPQADLAKWIQDLGFEVDSNNRQLIAPQELDIIIHSKKLAIEYCGLAWHGERRKELRSYHFDKLEAVEAAGYRLVTVFADEWLEKPLAVKGYLRAILGVQGSKLGARDLEFVRLPWSNAKTFLDQYHIQGSGAPLADTYGLLFDNEIVAVATLKPVSLTRRGRATEGMWELVRYCVKPRLTLVGGFDKLFAHFRRMHNPKVVTSYSDRRWSQGGIYRRAGFELASTLPPSYWYFKKNTDFPRFHKSKFRKSAIGALPHETEWEVMQRIGYDRIWDCGICKWVWTVL